MLLWKVHLHVSTDEGLIQVPDKDPCERKHCPCFRTYYGSIAVACNLCSFLLLMLMSYTQKRSAVKRYFEKTPAWYPQTLWWTLKTCASRRPTWARAGPSGPWGWVWSASCTGRRMLARSSSSLAWPVASDGRACCSWKTSNRKKSPIHDRQMTSHGSHRKCISADCKPFVKYSFQHQLLQSFPPKKLDNIFYLLAVTVNSYSHSLLLWAYLSWGSHHHQVYPPEENQCHPRQSFYVALGS